VTSGGIVQTPKEQLLIRLKAENLDSSCIIAADVSREIINDAYDPETQDEDFRYHSEHYVLRLGHSEDERQAWLDQLDYHNDDALLTGTVWLTESRWMVREEYDGWARRWEFYACPALPGAVL